MRREAWPVRRGAHVCGPCGETTGNPSRTSVEAIADRIAEIVHRRVPLELAASGKALRAAAHRYHASGGVSSEATLYAAAIAFVKELEKGEKK